MRSKRYFTCFMSLVVAVCSSQVVFATNQLPTKEANEFRVNDWVLKTKPARRSKIAPLVEALVAFDKEVDSNNDQAPRDARKRLQKINELAPMAKAELVSLANQLKRANEVEEFNAFIAAKVRESKSERWSSQFKAAGGDAYAILVNAPNLIDELIAERTQLTDKQNSTGRSGLLNNHRAGVVNLKSNAPRFLSTVCSFIVFVATLGTGTDFNYHACLS